MKQIKTLTVNGNTYEIADPDAAHIADQAVGENTWSSQNIVDRLCPAFTESGAAVTCRPVEGYPLEVVSHIRATPEGTAAIRLTRCGKNLLDPAKILRSVCKFDETTGLWTTVSGTTANGWHKSLLTGENGMSDYRTVSKLIRVPPNTPITFTIHDYAAVSTVGESLGSPRYLYLAFHDGDGKHLSAYNFVYKDTVTVTSPDVESCFVDIRRSTGTTAVSFSSLQLEIGDTATGYEPYRGQTFTAQLGQTVAGGSYDWASGVLTDGEGNETTLTPTEICGLPGINTVFCDTGDTTVTGKADPAAVMEQLTNAIIALGGNV